MDTISIHLKVISRAPTKVLYQPNHGLIYLIGRKTCTLPGNRTQDTSTTTKTQESNKNKTGQLGGTRAGIGGSRRTFAPDIRLHLHECVPEGRTDPTGWPPLGYLTCSSRRARMTARVWVTHPSTTWAQRCLTSLSGWAPLASTQCARGHKEASSQGTGLWEETKRNQLFYLWTDFIVW